MKHFFYDDTFCTDLEDLANVFNINKDNVNELKDDWQVKVELSDLEPIFNIDAENLCQLLADANEDRLSEDFDEEDFDLLFDEMTDAMEFALDEEPMEFVAKGGHLTAAHKKAISEALLKAGGGQLQQ